MVGIFLWFDVHLISAANRGKQGGDMDLNLRKCSPLGPFVGASSFVFFFMMVLQYICIFSMGFIKVSKKGNYFTLQYLEQLLRTDLKTMTRSILYAFIVSFVGTFFAMLFAYYMERRKVPFRRTLDCMVTLPYMLPGTCFGIGYILAFNHKPLKLTGTALIVIACMIFICTKVCSATLKQVPHSLERAVHGLGGGQIAVIRDIILPGLRPAFLSCFANNFSISMTTAGAIIFLIDPARKLAVFKLFDAVYTGDYALAALIATLIVVIVLVVEPRLCLLDEPFCNLDAALRVKMREGLKEIQRKLNMTWSSLPMTRRKPSIWPTRSPLWNRVS